MSIPEVSSRNRLLNFLKKYMSAVYVSGTPSNNQVPTWTNATTIQGESGLTFDGAHLTVGGASAKLTIEETDGTDYRVVIDPDNGPLIQFGNDTSDGEFMTIGAYSNINNIDTEDRDFHLYGSTTTTGLYFDEGAGKFGIKDASPSYELDVAGDIGFTGTLYGTSGNTIIGNAGSGYIDLKSANATYGVLIRDNDSTDWTNLNSANGYFQIAYNHSSLTQGLFITEPSTDTTRVGINDSSPSYPFDCGGDAQFTGLVRMSGLEAGSYTNVSIGTTTNKLYENTSTRKAKTNIDYDDIPGLQAVLQLKPAEFDFLNGEQVNMLGLIAEDAVAVDERLVYMGPDYSRDEFGSRVQRLKEDESGPIGGEYILDSNEVVPTSVNETALLATLIKSLQELKAENDALLLRVEQLENA
mgnify:CR=1 FL=1